jgi:hypothetical protein
MHFTNLVGKASVKQYSFGGRRFTCVHMRTDANISVPADRSFACHDLNPRRKVVVQKLKAVVGESLVRFCHAVHVFTLLHCITLTL